MKCPKCGTENEGKFCSNCGASLSDSSVATAEVQTPPSQEPPKKKGTAFKIGCGCLGALIVFIVFVGVIAALVGSDDTQSSNTSETTIAENKSSNESKSSTIAKESKRVKTTTTKKTAKKPGIGDEITVGEVKWIVGVPEKKEIIKGANKYQEPAKPNGVFIVVPLTAELVGKETGNISASQLTIIDSKNRKFEPTEDYNVSAIYSGKTIIYKQVNPNVPIKGVAVFDIAKDAAGLRLEIEDLRMFSDSKPGYVELGL